MGSISFDDRGYLWALFGEKTVPDEAQNLDSPLGALVRIEPNRDDDGDGFEPAPGNPLAGRGEAGAAIYAYGLRSPWRGALDREGRYWIGDVGELAVEELNVAVDGGENFGWPHAEGPCERDCAGLTDAVTTWDHSGADLYTRQDGLANLTVGEPPVALASRVVWVGTAYTDPDHDRYAGLLTGRTVFGDYCAGFVRVAELNDDGTLGVDQPVGHLTTPVAWRQGPDDYIYAISGAACQTDRANPADAPSRLYRAVLADS